MSSNGLESEEKAAIPGSLTDLAKGLRELIAFLRDLAEFVGDGNKVVAGKWRARRSRVAARNLDVLSFSHSGSRQFLERIAEGSGTVEDLAGIEKMLEATASGVEQSMQELYVYRDMLRETCGMAAAEKLDEIIHGKFGKGGLRRSLARIVEIGRDQKPLPREVVQIASDALQNITNLNEQIGHLHDLVLAKIEA
jgi:hypothetical protein